jgi:D-inositol-3-phosphate glycosyltransferase
MKMKMLWVGDAVCASGFARATHKTLDLGFVPKDWEIHVLGLNYLGDPHDYPYKVYPCYPGGDGFGVGRIKKLVTNFRPDVVVIQNDPWNFGEYLDEIENLRDTMVVLGAVAVDGLNCNTKDLNRLDGCVFWTQFALHEARACGYDKPAVVIPLGVDREVYKPLDRVECRRDIGLPEPQINLETAFILGNVNRNQPRKRLDLAVRIFCEWVKSRSIDDAYLYLHVAPTGDRGWDVKQLMKYYGVTGRLILVQPHIGQGISEEDLAKTYNAFNAMFTTTQGEGFGLTTLEGMACRIPQIVPNWSALGDWARDGTMMVPCGTTLSTPNYINVIGGVPNEADMMAALDTLYYHPVLREEQAERGFQLACRPEFNWSVIASEFEKFATTQALTPKTAVPAHEGNMIGGRGGR